MEIRVRNKYNFPIGYIKDQGDRISGYLYTRGYCGFYSKSSDITFDKNGQVFCYGNGIDALVREMSK